MNIRSQANTLAHNKKKSVLKEVTPLNNIHNLVNRVKYVAIRIYPTSKN